MRHLDNQGVAGVSKSDPNNRSIEFSGRPILIKKLGC